MNKKDRVWAAERRVIKKARAWAVSHRKSLSTDFDDEQALLAAVKRLVDECRSKKP